MDIPNLTERLRRELEFANYSNSTINQYESCLKQFINYFNSKYNEPKKIPTSAIKEYVTSLHGIAKKKQAIGCLKLFYKHVCKQPKKLSGVAYPKGESKKAIILSDSELRALFGACTNLKHRTIMEVMYGTGVRVSELLNIKLSDIDRANGVIHIHDGKGCKQRHVTLSSKLLSSITRYWRAYRSEVYLFEGVACRKYSASSINQFLKKYAAKAGVKKRIYAHLLRHNYTTSSLKNGENLYITQKCLGHKSPSTTSNYYYHISPEIVSGAFQPTI